MFTSAKRRATNILNHLTSPSRTFTTSPPIMAPLTINSTTRMNSGYEIPLLGFGVYQTPMDVAEQVTAHAVKSGYRHADSAAAYRNEAPTASGLLSTKLPRSELFFTSKVPPKAINYEAAKAVVDESLKLTGLEYIDLYLLHAPYGGKENRLGAWRALVEAVEEGKVRSIGVSNYGVHHLEELEEWMKQTEEKEGKGKGGVLSVNQVELHPWLARDDIVEWCEKRGVVLEVSSLFTMVLEYC
jgi:diketogulonate reductase-like aldo/keto reductase